MYWVCSLNLKNRWLGMQSGVTSAMRQGNVDIVQRLWKHTRLWAPQKPEGRCQVGWQKGCPVPPLSQHIAEIQAPAVSEVYARAGFQEHDRFPVAGLVFQGSACVKLLFRRLLAFPFQSKSLRGNGKLANEIVRKIVSSQNPNRFTRSPPTQSSREVRE